MIIDANEQFSDKQSIVATSYSTNVIEIIPVQGVGLDMAVQIVVRSESGTTPTLTVEVETSSDASTFTKLLGTAKPTGEKIFSIPLHNIQGLLKYLRLRYVVGGGSPSYNITAMLLPESGFSSKAAIQNMPDSPRQH